VREEGLDVTRGARGAGWVEFRFFSFFFFFCAKKKPGLRIGSGLSQVGLNLHFQHFHHFFRIFVVIIQDIQNKIKSNKNLKIMIITSINRV